VDKSKVGRNFHGVEIKDISKLKKIVSKKGIKIAIITVSTQFAQAIADALVDAGIEAILNISAAKISVPKNVILRNIDLSLKLEELSFFLTHPLCRKWS
jgi:redox-sensing transcriptional repressor